jgi:hypothetical protein
LSGRRINKKRIPADPFITARRPDQVSPALRQPLTNPLQIHARQLTGLLRRQNFAAHVTHSAVRHERLTNNPFMLKEGNLDSSFLCRGHSR